MEFAAKDRPLRLGMLLSGRGSNFLAIAESIRAGRLKGVEIAVVISNVAEAGGLQAARELGLPHGALRLQRPQTRRARRRRDRLPQSAQR